MSHRLDPGGIEKLVRKFLEELVCHPSAERGLRPSSDNYMDFSISS
jgi:hypothetical protein